MRFYYQMPAPTSTTRRMFGLLSLQTWRDYDKVLKHGLIRKKNFFTYDAWKVLNMIIA